MFFGRFEVSAEMPKMEFIFSVRGSLCRQKKHPSTIKKKYYICALLNIKLSNMKISGKVIHVGEIETIGEKGFQKRIFVIKTDDKYPQELPFELSGEKLGLINDYDPANEDLIEVDYNLKGRPWNGKWFMSAEAWRITGTPSKAKSGGGGGYVKPEEIEGDLPF